MSSSLKWLVWGSSSIQTDLIPIGRTEKIQRQSHPPQQFYRHFEPFQDFESEICSLTFSAVEVKPKRIYLTALAERWDETVDARTPGAANLRRQGQQSRGPPNDAEAPNCPLQIDQRCTSRPRPSRSPLNTDRREEAPHHINGHHVGRPRPSCRRCWQGERHSLIVARCHPLLDCRRRNRKSSVLGDS